jgi:hypothetical protein
MYDALDYVGNVSTWAQSGSDDEQSNQEWWGLPYYARGFLSNTVLTDFFARVEYRPDSYNTTSFTVSRGPNAVLYGVGQPGGVVNVSRKRPILGADFIDLKLIGNSDGGFRASGDVNQSYFDGKLGMRIAAVGGDISGFRDGDYDKRNGIYGALTYRPIASTTITVTYEDATHDRAIGSNNVFYDGVTPWIEAGSPIYDSTSSGPVPAGIRLSGVRAGSPTYIQGRPDLGVGDYSDSYIGNYWGSGDMQRTSFTEDNAIFDLTDLITGGDSNVKTGFKDLAVFFEQKLMTGMFLELAYNKVEIRNEVNRLSRVHDYIVVDVNKYLPNGELNPFAGVPYLDIQRSEITGQQRDYETMRATYTWTLDFSERNFGRYTLLGMYEEVDEEFILNMYRLQNGDPLPGANSRAQHASNRIRHRVYLNSSITPDGVEAYDMFEWDQAGLESALPSAEWGGAASAPRHEWGDRESWVLALQGDFFKSSKGFDYLSVMYGLRHDNNGVWAGSFSGRNSDNYHAVMNVFETKPSLSTPGYFDGVNDYVSTTEPTILDDNTSSYSILVRPLSNVTLYYNYSDVLIAGTASQVDIYGNVTPPTKGVTDDIGIRVSLLDEKLFASFTYFTTSAENQAINDIHADRLDVIQGLYEAIDGSTGPYQNIREWYFLRDDETTGFEFSLSGKINRTTIRLSVSHQDTVISAIAPRYAQWVSENKSYWESFGRDTPLSVTPDGAKTIGEAVDILENEAGNYQGLIGSAPGTQRDYKVVCTVVHPFDFGRVKNLRLGATYRWESADTIGYALDPVTGLEDASRGFKGDALSRFDAFVSYSPKLFESADLTLRLHVRNLFDDDDLYARQAIDDGSGNPYRTRLQLQTPRTFSLSADLQF